MRVISRDSCGACERELKGLLLESGLPDLPLVTGKGQPAEAGALLCGRCAIESGGGSYAARGCPVSRGEVLYILRCLGEGVKPRRTATPVCLECRAAGNDCLFLRGMPCKGVITAGGCGARCPSMGSPCTGCRGAFEGANIELWERLTASMGGRE